MLLFLISATYRAFDIGERVAELHHGSECVRNPFAIVLPDFELMGVEPGARWLQDDRLAERLARGVGSTDGVYRQAGTRAACRRAAGITLTRATSLAYATNDSRTQTTIGVPKK